MWTWCNMNSQPWTDPAAIIINKSRINFFPRISFIHLPLAWGEGSWLCWSWSQLSTGEGRGSTEDDSPARGEHANPTQKDPRPGCEHTTYKSSAKPLNHRVALHHISSKLNKPSLICVADVTLNLNHLGEKRPQFSRIPQTDQRSHLEQHPLLS